uniref:Uncharacterized protein n=1 Tax=Arundo donax TaxID=35708 RepID=A0A0A9SZ85_ARUDO
MEWETKKVILYYRCPSKFIEVYIFSAKVHL